MTPMRITTFSLGKFGNAAFRYQIENSISRTYFKIYTVIIIKSIRYSSTTTRTLSSHGNRLLWGPHIIMHYFEILCAKSHLLTIFNFHFIMFLLYRWTKINFCPIFSIPFKNYAIQISRINFHQHN